MISPKLLIYITVEFINGEQGTNSDLSGVLLIAWGLGSLFLGIKEVTRFRGNPTSAFAFCYQGEPKKWSDV